MSTMDGQVRSHALDEELLRSDDFAGTLRQRQEALLALIGAAMGKRAQLDV